jgi:endonuclease-3 related protein
MLQPATNSNDGLPAARDRALSRYYHRLLEEFGPQGWWPAETQLEVILGAILTQNTTWRNAALAIGRLREPGLLNLTRLRAIRTQRLQALIRPAGFFKQKARTIQGFVRWLDDWHHGSLERMFQEPADRLRGKLLELRGLGPETVDAMLLYAGGKPFFVADAYTRRILARHGMLPADANYHQAQQSIHRSLDRDTVVYNEFHALLVEVGKRHCRLETPRCGGCPLQEFLPERERRPSTSAV